MFFDFGAFEETTFSGLRQSLKKANIAGAPARAFFLLVEHVFDVFL